MSKDETQTQDQILKSIEDRLLSAPPAAAEGTATGTALVESVGILKSVVDFFTKGRVKAKKEEADEKKGKSEDDKSMDDYPGLDDEDEDDDKHEEPDGDECARKGIESFDLNKALSDGDAVVVNDVLDGLVKSITASSNAIRANQGGLHRDVSAFARQQAVVNMALMKGLQAVAATLQEQTATIAAQNEMLLKLPVAARVANLPGGEAALKKSLDPAARRYSRDRMVKALEHGDIDADTYSFSKHNEWTLPAGVTLKD